MTAASVTGALAAVPAVETLTDRQQRGADCVRCGAELVAGQVTDLGSRPLIVHGVKVRWFPRACRPGCAS